MLPGRGFRRAWSGSNITRRLVGRVGEGEESISSGARLLVQIPLRGSHFISLGLSFLFCKMGGDSISGIPSIVERLKH